MSIILGIDPGSHVTGFGVLKVSSACVEHLSHGIILLPKDEELPQRLKVLFEGLETLFTKHKPDHVVVEKIFLGKNADSAFKLGHARGLVLTQAALFNAHFHEYATRVVKKGIAGKGSAEKEQVRFMIEKLLGIDKIDRLDASDALALALYHSYQQAIHRVKEAES